MERNVQELTHLFFADDSHLCMQTSMESTKVLKEILEKYVKVSRQQINNQKSIISFAQPVSNSQQQPISNMLGMPAMVQMQAKCLGNPCLIGKSKKQVFGYIKDYIIKKVKG